MTKVLKPQKFARKGNLDIYFDTRYMGHLKFNMLSFIWKPLFLTQEIIERIIYFLLCEEIILEFISFSISIYF